MMTSILDILPADIFSCIFNEWLSKGFEGLRVILNFDSALCISNLRSEYLSLSNKYLHFILSSKNYSKVDKFIKWKNSRNFQIVSLTTSIKSRDTLQKMLLKTSLGFSSIRSLYLEVSRENFTVRIEIQQLFIKLPKLEELFLQHCEILSSNHNNNELQNTTSTIPLTSLKLTWCYGDVNNYHTMLSSLQQSCKMLNSIRFINCFLMYLPFLAKVLSFLPSLRSLEYVQNVSYQMCPKYRCVKGCGNNLNYFVDTSLPEYNYYLPNLKRVIMSCCDNESDVVIAILSGAVNLEEVSIPSFTEAAPIRSKQLISILARSVKTTLRRLHAGDISDGLFEQVQSTVQQYRTERLVLQNQHDLTNYMIDVISHSMPILEQMEWHNISNLVPQAGITTFIKSPQCFTNLKTFALSNVCIKEETLLQMLSKCTMLKHLNLDFHQENTYDNSFGYQYFLNLIKLPVVQQLVTFYIIMDGCEDSNKALTNIDLNDMLGELVECWEFPFLKHFKASKLFMNKMFYRKIFESPNLISYNISYLIPIKQDTNENDKEVFFESLVYRGKNWDELNKQREKDFTLLFYQ